MNALSVTRILAQPLNSVKGSSADLDNQTKLHGQRAVWLRAGRLRANSALAGRSAELTTNLADREKLSGVHGQINVVGCLADPQVVSPVI